MKYQLIKKEISEIFEENKPFEIVLRNRGVNNPSKYCNLRDSDIHDFHLLSNIDEAVSLLQKHMDNKGDIVIIVDSDLDGYCSASIIYHYLIKNYEENFVNYLIHTGKQHGLSKDIFIPEGTDLVIIPDAGTNDTEQCKVLKDRGIDILILDHHEKEIDNPYAVIVNPKICDYPNKELSGSAVVYKFIQAVDENSWNEDADKYLDLVALSLIGDGMDLRSYESKRLVEKGLDEINNKLFIALLDKQAYSMNGSVNINSIQFYIVPLVNALVRSGTQEEKNLMFRGFIETDEFYPYKNPRNKDAEEVMEDIYSRVARLATNAKAKQNREIDKAIEQLEQAIKKHKWDENKILFVNGDGLDTNFTGLVSMKLASKYAKPCVVIRPTEWKPGFYGGSARNFDGSPIDDLKAFLTNTGMFSFCQGHASAFGVEIKGENIRETIARVNEALKDTDFEKIWQVDFIFDVDNFSQEFIRSMSDLKDYYCSGISESLIAIRGIRINTRDIEVLGKESNTWKFSICNGDISVVKFKCDQNDGVLSAINDWSEDMLEIEIVGKCSINEFNGMIQPQIIVQDFNLI